MEGRFAELASAAHQLWKTLYVLQEHLDRPNYSGGDSDLSRLTVPQLWERARRLDALLDDKAMNH